MGSLLVSPINSTNLTLTAVVDSDPCPSVLWMFNGTDISADNLTYSFDDPCSLDSSSPFTFNLTISTLNDQTSGFYSALFDNEFSALTILPDFFVTVPGMYAYEQLPDVD